jgi:hypothetical protein
MNLKNPKKKIKQVYIPYWEWEDWKAGMWRKIESAEEEFRLLEAATAFTGDHILYGGAMKEVITEWPKTMLNSLTNPSVNKRAFLGHCAVQFKIGIPEYIVRMAWKKLTDQQRHDADKVAQETVDNWLYEHA